MINNYANDKGNNGCNDDEDKMYNDDMRTIEDNDLVDDDTDNAADDDGGATAATADDDEYADNNDRSDRVPKMEWLHMSQPLLQPFYSRIVEKQCGASNWNGNSLTL